MPQLAAGSEKLGYLVAECSAIRLRSKTETGMSARTSFFYAADMHGRWVRHAYSFRTDILHLRRERQIMSEAISNLNRFEFTKTWMDPVAFPTYEGSETKVREDMQALHDESIGLAKAMETPASTTLLFPPLKPLFSLPSRTGASLQRSWMTALLLWQKWRPAPWIPLSR